MTSTVEFWTWGALTLGDNGRGIEEQAAAAERAGWDGMSFFDSGNNLPDTFAALTLAARATTRLKLSTGVTTTLTRHPSVMANAAATLQQISGGRFTLGVGRGDSAVAQVGRMPAPLRVFEDYLRVVRNQLHGIDVTYGDLISFNAEGAPVVPHLDPTHLATQSRLNWLASYESPPPIEVHAAGPKTIGIGSTAGDQVCLVIGADPRRVEWGVSVAREARRSAGLDPSAFCVGLSLNVLAHPDAKVATGVVRTMVTAIARYSVMNGRAEGPVDGAQAEGFRGLREGRIAEDDGSGTSWRQEAVTDEFIDSYGVVGHPERCIEKLVALVDLGVAKFAIMPANPAVPAHLESNPDLRRANECLLNEVIPAVRAKTGSAGASLQY